MAELVVVTDSTADLPLEIREKYGIVTVPLKVLFGNEALRDGVDISSSEFFARMKSSDSIPTTSQPSPGEFAEVYENLLSANKEIISIHISSQLSGTMHSAVLAQSLVGGADRITVMDSKAVSLALGMMVVEAAKSAQEGKGKEEIISMVESMVREIRIYFLVDTLEYLARGGRIGKAQSLLGTLLNIKPILTFNDGIITPFDKVRGFNKAVQRIIDSINEEFGNKEVTTAFVHGTDMEIFEQFHSKIVSSINSKEVLRSQLGPVVGAHGGPGVVAVVCWS